MLAGHSHKLLEEAASESIERIQLDRRKAPQRLKPLLAYIEENLFNPTLDVNQLKRSCGVRDNSVPIQFHSAVGRPPHGYIEDRRLETACRLLADTNLKIWQISELLGYSSIQVFSRAFSRWSGQRPTLFRKKARRGNEYDAGPESESTKGSRYDRSLVATESLRKALDGELAHEEAGTLIERLLQLYPTHSDIDGDAPELTDDDAPTGGLATEAAQRQAETAQLRGNAHDRYQAETIWNKLEGEDAERQNAILAETTLTSAALFHFLLDKSSEIGREDPQGGVLVADLALVSLESVIRRKGDEQHFANLKAQAWTRIASARSLALDLRGAEEGLAEAGRFVELGGRVPEIETDCMIFKATLRRDQRRFLEAREILEQALALCPEDNAGLQVKTMLVQASVRFEEGSPAAAIPFLEQALLLADESAGMTLTLAVYHNLVAAYSEAGQYEKAVALMPATRRLALEHGTSYSRIRFRWLEGVIARGLGDFDSAEEAMLEARDAFSALGDGFSTALVCLDLADIYARQDRNTDLVALCASMTPVSETLQQHREAVVALKLFQRAAEERSMTTIVVERARKALLQSRRRPSV
ncbi:MAG: helix-turn-helix domain-containing protein [bacterium]|nr:helix-turn-helix domain-containing protein [bacterium]